MGKNRPVVAQTREVYVYGFRETKDFIIKWIMVSAVFSYVAMFIWNNAVSSIFSLRSVDFLQAWGIFALIAIARFAFYSLKLYTVRP